MNDAQAFGQSLSLRALWKVFGLSPRLREFLNGPAALKAAQWLLALLVLGCVLTPRIQVGILSSFYRVDVRLDDLFLFAALLAGTGWLVKPIVFREAAGGAPSCEKALLLFLAACLISVLSGLSFRTVDKPLVSFFYVLKWTEYFLVFAVTWRIAFWAPDRRFFTGVFFALGILLAAYGYWEHFFPAGPSVYPNYYRLFERPPFHGDANHVGGLLVLWMGVFTGFFLKSEKRGAAMGWLASLAFAFFPLVWTYSRKSYFALAGALIVAFLVPASRRRVLFLAAFLVVLGLALPTRLGERLADLGDAF
ncbi:MAG: hypothetical protein HY714_06465, partial [Candidatus Omnitrophica bacterium]|nr:hypothetical protein [Candidatus Omnitrophota bacterium]